MPALVKRSTPAGDRSRVDWLAGHSFSQAVILEALRRIDAGETVQPQPAMGGAKWAQCCDNEAFLFPTLELADAVARLLREPGTLTMVWAEPRLTGDKPEGGRVTEVGSRRFVSKRRGRESTCVHSEAIERDWHNHAVNSGGNDL